MPTYKLSVEVNREQNMSDYEKFNAALRKNEEEKYSELQNDIKKVRNIVEKMLTSFFESTANQAKTNYYGLEMY